MSNSNESLLPVAVGAALIGGAVWYAVSRNQSEPPPPPPPPPPPSGRLILVSPARLEVIAGEDVVGPGGVARLNGIDALLIAGTYTTWSNPTDNALLLNRRIELAHRITFSPDETWVVFEPGRGIVQDFPGLSIGYPSFSGETGALLVPARSTIDTFWGIFVAGPANSFAAASFWNGYEDIFPGADICFNIAFQFFQMPTIQSVSQQGVLLGEGSWGFDSGTPGFCLDIDVVMA